jgi:hypothetical protein
MVVMARSVPLIIRVMISVQAQASAETDQAHCRGDPAAQADLLAQKDDRQRGDEQRCDEAGGGCFRNGKEAQARDEEQRRTQ